jgi:hypothetical protein
MGDMGMGWQKACEEAIKMLCPTHKVEIKRLPVLWGLPIQHKNLGRNHIIGGCDIPGEMYKYGFRCPVDEEEYFFSKDGNLILKERERDNE